MGKRYYDWNKNFTFSNSDKNASESLARYSSSMLNTDEAMEYLGIGRRKIKSLIDSGELKPIVVRDKYNDKKFSYHFDIEELSVLRLERIFSKR